MSYENFFVSEISESCWRWNVKYWMSDNGRKLQHCVKTMDFPCLSPQGCNTTLTVQSVPNTTQMDTLHEWNEKPMAFNLFRFGFLNDQTILQTVRGMELLKSCTSTLVPLTISVRFDFFFFFFFFALLWNIHACARKLETFSQTDGLLGEVTPRLWSMLLGARSMND